ncbi:unknown [Ruminococcus sp. CAG:563]|nr:unknown [Ruminococcus sp. CAG:563]
MKKEFAFIKNLILAVASALTLIAVSFAWFSNSSENFVPSIKGEVVSPTYASVAYYEADNKGNYSRLTGNIELKNWSSGSFKKYKMILTTATDEKLKLSMSINELPSNMNSDLKKSVQVKYNVYKATKTMKNGVMTFNDGALLFSSDYMSLADLSNGKIFDGRSLADSQTEKNDVYIIYYEIGLSADSPSSIEGLSSSLGTLQISVQPVS